ncbi:MAG TPA: hypothetical protein VHX44_04565 [Planctomycetota bacterium]|nr:hypothetical protein [Planctomycetota bacterium]
MRPLAQSLLLGAGLIGLTVAAQAADEPTTHSFTDLRIEGTLLPDTFDVDAKASGPLGSVSRSGDENFDDAWRVGIIGVSARASDSGLFAFGSGGGIQYSRWHDGGDVEETLQALTATLRLGLVIRPTPFFHLEAMPYGAVGAARGDINDEESDISVYWEFGGIAGAFLTLDNFQIGVHAGYLWNGTDLDYDTDDNYAFAVDNATVKLRGEGAFFGASIGGRF